MKILRNTILVLVALIVLAGILGTKYFNSIFYSDTPDTIVFSGEFQPIKFDWLSETHGDYSEPHEAIFINIQIPGIPHKLSMQFDSGAPSTIFYEKPLQSLINGDFPIKFAKHDHQLKNFDFEIQGNKVHTDSIRIMKNYGASIDLKDTAKIHKIGTIGADFFSNKIVEMDFKNQVIKCYREKRPDWMNDLKFQPFEFKGRRFILPGTINGKKMRLMWDSGSSAFGLIVGKNKYEKYADKNAPEINLNANSWGDQLPIYHKKSNQPIEIGGETLTLKRVSYVDKYVGIQGWIAPFSKIKGMIGNRMFTESVVIFDTKTKTFAVTK